MATNPTSKARSKVRFYFESEIFYAATSKDITPYLAARRQAARVGPVPFVVIASISGDPKWFSDSISKIFLSPKSGPLLDILYVQKWERGTVVLPTIKKDLQCINFFMQYPIIEKAKSDVKFCPVTTRAYALRSSSPVVLMVCRDNEVPERLQKQCVSTN
ncbi:hypothetical protein K458DRAFT_492974 [Lentithecium fluviatile CBS 122367]|uniref:Uncharacterized protein n=1 Tax=Lentithecium fluviatile CBS 122367 TaxID=1168545 RepID=A0A6G1IBM9_9PLEO|nr:hypothetical protein K458DRAFT_492974 [Lentithecium fluviatile CBS 122367]